MIATLNGIVAEKLTEHVVIDVQGVGYGVLVNGDDYSSLSTSDKAKVYIYEHIRENAHELYGFVSMNTKKLFEQLLAVNGVGPRMALNILSIGSLGDVQQSIAEGNTKYIQTASGVGKRVAERVVVDLKDKMGLSGVDLQNVDWMQSNAVDTKDEAISALVSLGYSAQDAVVALKPIDKSLTVEERVKLALKGGHR